MKQKNDKVKKNLTNGGGVHQVKEKATLRNNEENGNGEPAGKNLHENKGLIGNPEKEVKND